MNNTSKGENRVVYIWELAATLLDAGLSWGRDKFRANNNLIIFKFINMDATEQITNPKINLEGIAPLLQVFDMPTSLHFYRDILGFDVVQSSGQGDDVDWVLLKLNEIELMLNTAYEKPNRPTTPDLKRNAAHSDTILYFGCPDTDATYCYLIDKGLDIRKPQITGYGWKALNVMDPDGYHLCFHYPRSSDSL